MSEQDDDAAASSPSPLVAEDDNGDFGYYEANARAYFGETVDVDLAPIYERFLSRVGPAGEGPRILDAGCGSGRDSLALSRMGYDVDAFDASPAMAALASTLLGGKPVKVLKFQDVDLHERKFDGVWACASLLHVPPSELPDAFGRLAAALKEPGGVLYASFKYGSYSHGGQRQHRDGRRFTDLDEVGLEMLLREVVPAMAILETWTTLDRRPGRKGETWLNARLVRSSRLLPQPPSDQADEA